MVFQLLLRKRDGEQEEPGAREIGTMQAVHTFVKLFGPEPHTRAPAHRRV